MGELVAAAAPASIAQPAEAPPPSPADAMRLYHRLDGWVRQWRVPGDAGGELEVRGVTAVAVTLRHEGQIVGRGMDATGGVRSLVLAAGRAMSEANTRLPVERDALFDEHVRAAAARITISLELAGTWVPILPEQWTDAAVELSMGVDGVAARVGERTAAVFPGEMLATGMDPGRGLASAVSRATDDPSLILKKPAELARDAGAAYYRFRTTHLAQTAPGRPPVFLHRGGRVVELAELDESELRRWADGLADNLMKRRWPGVERYGLQGTYDPLSGKYEAPFAPPLDQALAAAALREYWMNHRDTPRGEEIHTFLVDLVTQLAMVEPGERPPWDDPAAAALFVPWAADGDPAQVLRGIESRVFDEAIGKCRAVVDAAVDDAGVFAAAIPAAHRPLIAFALPMAAALPADSPLPALAHRRRAAIQSIYAQTPPGELTSTMPWLGIADLSTAAGEQPRGAAPPELASAVGLREMRSLMWQHQLRPDSLPPGDRDLAGGIVFTSSRMPLPSWHAARPLVFAARMLGDPRLTDPAETPREVVRLLASLRFLRQLTAGEAEGHMYADPARAAGGVRAAPWDQRMPVDATAMTLLAVCETLKTLDAIRARGGLRPDAP